jgi:hypothetical protein
MTHGRRLTQEEIRARFHEMQREHNEKKRQHAQRCARRDRARRRHEERRDREERQAAVETYTRPASASTSLGGVIADAADRGLKVKGLRNPSTGHFESLRSHVERW